MYRQVLTVIFLLICSSFLKAQSTNAAFRNITSADGLPQTSVSAVTQDAFGLIWIATWEGVFRYDGARFRKMTSSDSRFVTADKKGGVWIPTTNKGQILYYDSYADTLKSYYIRNPKEPNNAGPSGPTGIRLRIDDAGNVWVATQYSLYKYDSAADAFIRDNENFVGLNFELRTRGDGELLFVYREQGSSQSKLGYRSPAGKYRFMDFPLDANNPNQAKGFVEEYPPFEMAFLDTGFAIFNKYGWAYKADIDEPWTFRKPVNNQYLDQFDDVVIDARGNAWLSQFASLQKLDLKTGATVVYRQHERDNTSLLPRSGLGPGTGMFIDRQGVLWIPRFGSGISRLNLFESDFGLVKDDNGKVLLDVLSALEMQDGSYLIGSRTEPISLLRFNKDNQVIEKYGSSSFKAPEGKTVSDELSHPFPWALSTGKDGRLWIGTGWPIATDGGLNVLIPESKKFIRYKQSPGDPNSLPDNWVLSILQRRDGKFWMATARKGWMLFEPGLEKVYAGFDEMAGDDLDSHGLLLANDHLLFQRNGKFYKVNAEQLKSQEVPINFGALSSVALQWQDSNGKVWFTNDKGFGFLSDDFREIAWHFDITNKKFPAEAINALQFDNEGWLWLNTDNGLVRFDTATSNFIHYGIERGLQGNYFSRRLSYKGPSGKLYVGGNGGINVFDPAKILVNPIPPEMVFTGVALDGNLVTHGPDAALRQPAIVADEIIVGPEVSMITVSFAAIHFAGSERAHAQYRLEGFDKDWKEGGNEGVATFTNLPPGRYTLYIRGMNWDGVWSDGKESIRLKILPPWYQTWWAYSLYAFLFLLALRTLYRYQNKRALRKEREKAQLRELAQAKEIEKAYANLKATQAQLIQSEKMASLGELTAGIAHEIQNPLNFVNNFSEINSELIVELEDEARQGNLEEITAIAKDIKENSEKINHHGKRADAIVKGMLQHSRSSSGQKELTDINALCDEYLRLAYHGLKAKDQSFNATIKMDFDETIGDINIIPQDIGRVILNLINNSFYAVDEKEKQKIAGYEPTVLVSTRKNNNKVEIKVSDNGNGIPQKILEKIFQPFFTTKPTGQGTGLGLSLSYDIVKAHGGEITVKTKENEGTAFTIELPT